MIGPPVQLKDCPPDVTTTGRLIAMNPRMLKGPVPRRIQNHQITDTPVQTIDMQTEIRRLGIFRGFEHRLVA